MKRALGLAVLLLVLGPRLSRADGASIAGGAGVVSTEGIPATFYITGNLRIPLLPVLVLEPEVGYFKKDYTIFGFTASAEDLTLGGNALVVLPVHPLEVFGGAGLGAHRLTGNFNAPGLGSISTSETKLGIHLLAGLDIKVAPRVSLFGAGRYDIVHLSSNGDNLHETKFYGGVRVGL